MKWIDSREIAIALADAHPGRRPATRQLRRPARTGRGAARLRRRSEALGREDPRGDPDGVDRRGVRRRAAPGEGGPGRHRFARSRYAGRQERLAIAPACAGLARPHSRGAHVSPFRIVSKLVATLAVAACASLAPAQPLELKITAPAAPGGGWDGASRSLQQVMTATGAAKSVQVVNVPGAGGTVGLAQFVNKAKGDGNQLMVMGITMVGAVLTNKSPVRLDAVTPIARLTAESLVVVVPANSPHKTMQGPRGRAEGRYLQGRVGRRLGRRRRPHPRRPGHEGRRRRRDQAQLRAVLRRRRGARRDARRPRHRRRLRLQRVREPDQGGQAARAGDLRRQAHGRRRRADAQGAGPRRRAASTGAASSRPRASPRRRRRRSSARSTKARQVATNGPRCSRPAAGTTPTWTPMPTPPSSRTTRRASRTS